MIVLFETAIRDFAKSFSVLTVVQGSLAHLSLVFFPEFEIFCFLLLQGLFCTVKLSLNFSVILLAAVLETWICYGHCVYPSPAL